MASLNCTLVISGIVQQNKVAFSPQHLLTQHMELNSTENTKAFSQSVQRITATTSQQNKSEIKPNIPKAPYPLLSLTLMWIPKIP